MKPRLSSVVVGVFMRC